MNTLEIINPAMARAVPFSLFFLQELRPMMDTIKVGSAIVPNVPTVTNPKIKLTTQSVFVF